MKKGVSLISLIVSIIIIVIILGIIVVTSFDSIDVVTINEFAIEIYDIQTAVDEYKQRNESYPSGDTYKLNYSKVPVSIQSQFSGEQVVSGDINFKKIDLSLIGIDNNKLGLGEGEDVYVLSEQTGRVYYMPGVEFEGTVHYTITDKISEILGITPGNSPSFGIKIEDVKFELSTAEYTKEPITVKVKIPIDAIGRSIYSPNHEAVYLGIEGQEEVWEVNTIDTKTGNYYINVGYNYQGVSKSVQYAVVNYDDVEPEVEVAENIKDGVNIIKITAVDKLELPNGNKDNGSGISEIKYAKDIITDKSFFENQGIKLSGDELRVDLSTPYTIFVKDKVGNSTIYNGMPDDWRPNVTKLEDGVPIPKGFVASPYDDENKRDTGLVIYELTPEEVKNRVNTLPSDETQLDSWTTRNQYVWVPVNKHKFTTEFVRKAFLDDEDIIKDSDGNYYSLGTLDKMWELELDPKTNMPLTMKNTTDYKLDGTLNFISEETLLEAQEMYKSVKEYGGFYIARYEAGIDEQILERGSAADLPGVKEGTKVYFSMGKIPYGFVPFNAYDYDIGYHGAMSISRSLYPNTKANKTGVVSTLTYSVQLDRAVQWFLDTGAITSVSNSNPYGNYKLHVINNKDELNENALVWYRRVNDTYLPKDDETIVYPKNSVSNAWFLSTGALKAAKLNNIYDLAGNMAEWIMERDSDSFHVLYGGCANNSGAVFSLANRQASTYSGSADYMNSFRISLYIKLS